MNVEDWFENNTFHHSDFADIDKLVRLKKKKKLTISLCLPTLNVENTLGKILRVIKKTLIEEKPLLDEIAIIDSRSKDKTADIARKLGVQVYFDDEWLPEHLHIGKGGALWKSLMPLKGDIIAWIDSDIKNIHPRFVYGIVGPILTYDKIDYVKGFYRRPIKVNGEIKEMGGGRVTELTARPLFNAFYPDLAGFIQPLSGEYAGRRKILESVPFFTGYGVESGLQIDIYKKYGLEAMAQVDLDAREHENQSLTALRLMSFEIMQVFLKRYQEEGGVGSLARPNHIFSVFERARYGFRFESRHFDIVEKPPMNTIPGYIKLHKNMKKSNKVKLQNNKKKP